MKVLMLPHLSHFRSEESGIKRVVEAYFKYLPQFGVELAHPDADSYDLKAVHAGMTGPDCDVAHLHGLYWTADYQAAAWEYDANARIVEAVRQAKLVTVPSVWVTETFQRDVRFRPEVVPHGIDWQDWQHNEPNEGYVLWNKNRRADVCDNSILIPLAARFPDLTFVSTFAPAPQGQYPSNIKITENGVVPHAQMRRTVQRAGVYLSTTKETFGIGVLEAMAAGVPVLGWAHGGNLDLVQHGVNGYLAKPGDIEDLAEGLNYCLKFSHVLGKNGQELAKRWTWEAACQRVAEVYELALRDELETVSVVIPVYNKTELEIRRAIESVIQQTYRPQSIIVVDDGSDNETVARGIVEDYQSRTDILHYIRQPNSGVAVARNRGINYVNDTKYVCCLDADDWIRPTFLETCIAALEADRSLGIAYTGLWYVKPDGSEGLSPWPGGWNYDKQLLGQNQVPTCNVMRREVWERLGGQRQRYAPSGAGEEDAEMCQPGR